MQVAAATGRSVLEVADDSYALTLYTAWHLDQRQYAESIVRKSERLDLAGLMASAHHKPQQIHEAHMRFKASLRAVRGGASFDVAQRDRMLRAMLEPQNVRTVVPA